MIASPANARIADRRTKMKMVIADRRRTKVIKLQKRTTSQFIKAGLLICLAFILPIAGQQKSDIREPDQAQIEMDNGNYTKAIEIGNSEIEKARKTKNKLLIIELLDIIASSQIFLESYEDAEATLAEALREVSTNEADPLQKAFVYQRFAFLRRAQRKFAESLDYSRKALSIAPNNPDNQIEYYLNVGRILFSSGYDVSAIIWLEKAEKLVEGQKTTSAKLDVYRILSLAWSN